jgi:NADPH2:quinone reductase
MRLEQVPDPKPGQAVVRVHAAGVNPVDTYLRSGSYATKPSLPYTPGIDAAGVVESVGSDASQFKAGQRVYVAGTVSGAYAEFALCKASQIHPLPERVSYAQGAGVNVPYATAHRALFQRARVVVGEVVLVHGASGGVGVAAVQIARAAGLSSKSKVRTMCSTIVPQGISSRSRDSRTAAVWTLSSKCWPT